MNVKDKFGRILDEIAATYFKALFWHVTYGNDRKSQSA
jgi:hypothetical protein